MVYVCEGTSLHVRVDNIQTASHVPHSHRDFPPRRKVRRYRSHIILNVRKARNKQSQNPKWSKKEAEKNVLQEGCVVTVLGFFRARNSF